MRLPNEAHTSRPWRIHEVAPDFALEDVWGLPGQGGPGDFPRLVQLIASFDPAQAPYRVARALWAARWKVGSLLGWDDPAGGVDSRVAKLRDRLPADLAGGGPDFAALPFTSRAGQEIAHLSYKRVKTTEDARRWKFDVIAGAIGRAFRLFLENVDADLLCSGFEERLRATWPEYLNFPIAMSFPPDCGTVPAISVASQGLQDLGQLRPARFEELLPSDRP